MNFFDAIQPALLNAATVILTAAISVAAGMVAKLIYSKLGAEKYNKLYNFALDAWRITDEYFRITPNVEKTVDSTFEKFKETLLHKAPGLTDQQINDFRLAIAGALNEGREALDPKKLGEAPDATAQPAAVKGVNASDTTGAE
jgi:hypothetical protein